MEDNANKFEAGNNTQSDNENPVTGSQIVQDPLAAPAQKTTLKERWKHPRWLDTILVASILAVVIYSIGKIIASLITPSALLSEDANPNLYTIARYASTIGVWIVCILALTIVKRNRPILKTLKPGWGGNTPKYILIGAVLGFGMNSIVVLVASLSGSISLSLGKLDILPIIACFVAVLIQSSSEELLFRTYLFRKLRRNYHSPLVPFLVSAILFVVIHGMNPGMGVLPVLNLFVSGILFAAIIYYWNSFWAAAACHTLWNFTQNIIWGLPNSGQVLPMHIFQLSGTPTASFAYDPAFGIEGAILSTIVLAVACAAIILIGERKRRAQQPVETTESNA